MSKWICLLLFLFIPLFTFPSQEEWHYLIKWMGIIVGTLDIKEKEESPCLCLEGNLRTLGIYYLLYPVKDKIQSKIDPKTGKILSLEVNLREKGYRRKEKREFMEGAEFVDPLTLFYLLRFIKEGEREFRVYTHGEIKRIKIIVEKEEELKIYEDKFATRKLIPELDFQKFHGIVKKIRKVEMWVEKESGIPLKIEAKTSFGPVTVVLKNRKKWAKK
ncbi:MAG TPA: DUF3108 domain-containing protein [bacterium]|nr:DUF3108 domain-containing protein [bacterium]HEX68168.1 DUF3108 domain-containing protein [bacterium]